MKCLITLLFLGASLNVFSSDRHSLVLAATEAFKRDFPGRKPIEETIAFGDVNNDGLIDFVTFIGDPYPNESAEQSLRIGP